MAASLRFGLVTWGTVAITLAVRFAAISTADFVFDDAYIALRVARNIASGLGPVYNPGDPVQAVTSLPYAYGLAALWPFLGEGSLRVMRCLACISDAGTAGLVATSARRLAVEHDTSASFGALFAGVAYAMTPVCCYALTGGLETSFYNLALWLAFSGALRASERQTTVGCALAAWVRPDGILAVIAAIVTAGSWRAAARRAVGCGALIAPLYLGQWLYYGTCVPQTATAKRIVALSFAANVRTLARDLVYGAPFTVLFAVFTVMGIVVSTRRRSGPPTALVWLVLYALAICTSAAWWRWYMPPAVAVWCCYGGAGLTDVLRRWPRGARVAASVGAFAGVALMTTTLPGEFAWQRTRSSTDVRSSLDLARWFSTQPPGSILTEPLGRIGFYTQRPMEDYPGLASPRVTAALRAFDGPIPGMPSDPGVMQYVLERVSADYLVLRDCEFATARVAPVLGDYAPLYETRPEPIDPRNEHSTYVVLRRKQPARHGARELGPLTGAPGPEN